MTYKYFKPEHIRVFLYCEKPKGSWSVVPDKDVHIIHLPTGVEVKEFSSNSPHQNKSLACEKLNKLLEEKSNANHI